MTACGRWRARCGALPTAVPNGAWAWQPVPRSTPHSARWQSSPSPASSAARLQAYASTRGGTGKPRSIFVANTGAEAGRFTVSAAVRGLASPNCGTRKRACSNSRRSGGAPQHARRWISRSERRSRCSSSSANPARGRRRSHHVAEASGNCMLTSDASGRPVLTATASCAGAATFASGGTAAFESVPAAVIDVSGPWSVNLAPAVGTPQRIRLATLGSLAEQADPAVRHFSGTATYRRTVPHRRVVGCCRDARGSRPR